MIKSTISVFGHTYGSDFDARPIPSTFEVGAVAGKINTSGAVSVDNGAQRLTLEKPFAEGTDGSDAFTLSSTGDVFVIDWFTPASRHLPDHDVIDLTELGGRFATAKHMLEGVRDQDDRDGALVPFEDGGGVILLGVRAHELGLQDFSFLPSS